MVMAARGRRSVIVMMDHPGGLASMVLFSPIPISVILPSPSHVHGVVTFFRVGFLFLSCFRWTHLTKEPEPEPTMTSEEAWAAIVAADEEKDLDDFKVFFLEYVRNNKTLTFADLENKFRQEGLHVYLIAMVSLISQNPLPLSAVVRVLILYRKRRSRNKRRFVISRARLEKSTSCPSNLVPRIVVPARQKDNVRRPPRIIS